MEKEHQLKHATAYLPRTPSPKHPFSRSRPLRGTQPTFEESIHKQSFNKTLSQGLSNSQSLKKEELQATRQQRYQEIKKVKAGNRVAIQRQKDR